MPREMALVRKARGGGGLRQGDAFDNHRLCVHQALADLEQMAQRVSQLPGVAVVRGITRPTGESLQQARLSYQAGEVGTKLNDASTQINGRASDLNRLTDGADTLATSLLDVRT